jgi:hypothetical protein
VGRAVVGPAGIGADSLIGARCNLAIEVNDRITTEKARRIWMTVHHVNRRDQSYYLHQGTTKTGKPKYFFSKKSEGNLVDRIPDGFEVYENPNSQVFLRKIQPKLITDEEVALVEQGMKHFSEIKYYLIDVKKKTIIIYEAAQDVDALAELFSVFPGSREKGVHSILAKSITYSPMMQFVLIDEERRRFVTQRYCFRGSIDDWIDIGGPDKLQNLVKKYVKHLGQESYYSLF